MPKDTITGNPPVAQDVRTYAISKEHFDGWVESTKRNLADVRRKRKLPQTRDNHAVLAEREARYTSYLQRAGVLV